MKRETFANGMPKGLVFYAPLSQSETRDLVSGVNIEMGFMGSPKMEWDNVKSAYHFTATTGYGQAYRYVVPSMGLNLESQRTVECTIYAEVLYPNLSLSVLRSVWLGGYTNGNTCTYLWPRLDGPFGDVVNFSKAAVVYKNGIGTTYINSEVHSSTGVSFSINYTAAPVETINTLVSIGKSNTSTETQKTDCYVRNIMVFNRALSEKEIKQL